MHRPYKFKIKLKDGSLLDDDYTINMEKVAYIHIYGPPLAPQYLFFFTEGTFTLKRFFGKAFISTSGQKNYFYCLFTDKFRLYINAFDGTVVFTDDLTYMIKPQI